MDDANQPALLSLKYFGYHSERFDPEDKIAENTRRFILSSENPYFYQGSKAKGIGSIHTPQGNIWHMSMVMEALTTNDTVEVERIVRMLQEYLPCLFVLLIDQGHVYQGLLQALQQLMRQ